MPFAVIRYGNPRYNFWDIDSNKSFHIVPKENKMFFGVEWENDYYEEKEGDGINFLEEVENAVPSTINGSDLYWHKEDGSLYHGYETVTAPMTFEATQEFFYRLEDKAILSNTIGCDTQDIGVHVHVSKSGFHSKTQIVNAAYLVHNMRGFLYYTSQRRSDTYCRFYSANKSNDRDLYTSLGERYTAANMLPKRTIEFRYPGGRNSPLEVLEQVELVKHICDFSNMYDADLFTYDNIDNMKNEFARYLIDNFDMNDKWLNKIKEYL